MSTERLIFQAFRVSSQVLLILLKYFRENFETVSRLIHLLSRFLGLLVCFNLPGKYTGRVGTGGEPTPR